jgi:hypothetical protein
MRGSKGLTRKQRFFSSTMMPATDWRVLLYSHEPASILPAALRYASVFWTATFLTNDASPSLAIPCKCGYSTGVR